MIVFDKGERVLKKLDFPQPREMTVFQLTNSADAIARLEAAEKLSQTDESLSEAEKGEVVGALRSAIERDSFYGVREAAASALVQFKTKEAVNALIEGTKDRDVRVRAAAIASLKNINAAIDSRSPALQLVFSILFAGNEEAHAET